MPLLSIVLPCHKVEQFLEECLGSITGQSFEDFEVIAVDDASPDRSGQILEGQATRDRRIRVLHLVENFGLGRARNAGLAEATGDYVLFVDSDDLLAAGALDAIAGKLQRSRLDVLFYDYARLYSDGTSKRNARSNLFRHPPPPPVFTLRERPSVMNLMMVSWNRAFRRDFLADLGVGFRAGYYEDVPVTYPALMAAERIGMLDRVCYLYRQHAAEGSITRTASARHFDVFDQYRAVFEFMNDMGPSVEDFRPEMFRRMLWHYFVILQRRDRVRPEDRRPFFLRIADDFHGYRPAGYRHPAGAEGVRYRLAERRAYRVYRLLSAKGTIKTRPHRRWRGDRPARGGA